MPTSRKKSGNRKKSARIPKGQKDILSMLQNVGLDIGDKTETPIKDKVRKETEENYEGDTATAKNNTIDTEDRASRDSGGSEKEIIDRTIKEKDSVPEKTHADKDANKTAPSDSNILQKADTEINEKEDTVRSEGDGGEALSADKGYIPEIIEYKKDETPFGEEVFPEQPTIPPKTAAKSRYLIHLEKNGELCTEMEEGILLTAEYCGYFNRAFLKFYDLKKKKIRIWLDNTGHRPYCLHKDPAEKLLENEELISFHGYDGIETVEKYDLLEDRKIKMSKIYAKNPNVVGGSGSNNIKAILNGAWEANIQYHLNFLYDRTLIPGLLYSIKDGKIIPLEYDVDKEIYDKFMELYKEEPEEFREFADRYLKIFSQPIPDIPRVALDIEVDVMEDGHIADPRLARAKVISASFASTDGMRKVLLLDSGNKIGKGRGVDFPEKTVIIKFKSEKDLLREIFRVIWAYPVVITFNGDNFDLNYLFHRAKRLKLPESVIPIHIGRGAGMVSSHAYLKNGVHLDLYQIFSNRSLKAYAFGSKYEKNNLDEISKAFLHEEKIKHLEGERKGEKFSASDIAGLDLYTLAYYNLMDAVLTLKLTTFDNNTVWNLLIYLMRITKLPFQALIRHQISFWIRNLMYFEHRFKNYLIPRSSEIREKKPGGISKSITEGKGFQGAYVIPPVPGIHFNVVVADFSSLYPSIIKSRNLSYETINCPHKECMDNILPDTPYWACTRRVGIFALIVGFFRDVRVKWFKPRSSDPSVPETERQFAKVLQAALKVFINGSYGVFGSPNFPLFCLPVAEATTAIGRYAIKKTVEKAESLGVRVLYGDTDSTFLENPTEEQVNELIRWAKENLKIELEKEKTYKFLALSARKKNYVGIYKEPIPDYVDIKGMVGKKSNTPPFITRTFKKVTEILKKINNKEDFEKYKKEIITEIKKALRRIGKPPHKGGFPLEDYIISVKLTKDPRSYTKNKPQHVKVAEMEERLSGGKKKFGKGDYVNYVKTKDQEGAKPITYASIEDIDVKKYRELLEATFEQLLDALGIDFDDIKGTKKLDAFFGGK